jgi:hypothetical membrane protein
MASSAAAPLLLVGGWTVAARLQPPSFDPVSHTVSELMAVNAVDSWVMTTALLAAGICYTVTAVALWPAALAGRLILVAGAAAGMMVAVNPEPAKGGGSFSHSIWASLGFVGLAAWPTGAWRRDPSVPWVLRPMACFAAVAVQIALLAWFVAEVVLRAGQAGLAERVAAVAQALCPLVVMLSCRLSRVSAARRERSGQPTATAR